MAGSRRTHPTLTATSTREDLIDWLEVWDPNGCYSDEDSLAEFDCILTLTEAWEIIEVHFDLCEAVRHD